MKTPLEIWLLPSPVTVPSVLSWKFKFAGMWRRVSWSSPLSGPNESHVCHIVEYGRAHYAALVFPLALFFACLACSSRPICILLLATYSSRSALKMEAAPFSATLVAVPVYTALLVASSPLPWELQKSAITNDRPAKHWLCTLQGCKVQDILEDSSLSGYVAVSIGSYRCFGGAHLLHLQGSVGPRSMTPSYRKRWS